ncbi:hypothetical protein [Putridiphycobacter roseus]|nr:hypothetical protein [Putridiphycobacter roseus]
MKKLLKLIVCIVLMGTTNISIGQSSVLDSLFQATVSEFKTSGWFWFNNNTVPVSQIFTTYKPVFLPDTGDDFLLTKQWTDNQIQFQHARYQQTYNGIPVEGAEFTEHCRNGFVVYANGKLCPHNINHLQRW